MLGMGLRVYWVEEALPAHLGIRRSCGVDGMDNWSRVGRPCSCNV